MLMRRADDAAVGATVVGATVVGCWVGRAVGTAFCSAMLGLGVSLEPPVDGMISIALICGSPTIDRQLTVTAPSATLTLKSR